MTSLPRREFLRHSALAGASLAASGYFTSRAAAEPNSPNEKLNIACVGTDKQAAYDIGNVSSENIVALCDIDEKLLAKRAMEYPLAKTFTDWRKMLEQPGFDAVVVATPDHMHALPTLAALKLDKHVYCEKPLTHSVEEARLVAQEAAKRKVATQMGTQIHAGTNYRRVVELVQSGAIGPVNEVHVWVGTQWGGGERPAETPECPPNIHWDLWLGTAPERPYHPAYIPFFWRRWWDFGGGALNDMACHYMDVAFWALKLRSPTTVEAFGPPPHAETASVGIKVQYEFPARDNLPAVKFTWYDGDQAPKRLHDIDMPANGVLFVGDKGKLWTNYGEHKLYPEDQFKDFARPAPTIPDSIGHHKEWIQACKTGSPTTCYFDYAGALTETVLLGTVAYRAGKKLEWNAAELKATNCPEAERFIKKQYRPGWGLS